MEGLLVSRSVVGGTLILRKRSPLPCYCRASWSPINVDSQNFSFSPFLSFGNSSNLCSSMGFSRASVDPAAGARQSSANSDELAAHQEVTALVHMQKEQDKECPGQFRTLSEDIAMGLVLQAASGTGWTTGSGLEGPSNIFGLNGEKSEYEYTDRPLASLSKSPRRRMRVAFTCNVCGQRTTRAINPHAYTDGTVFVQCSGCNIFHKLVDNLKLFHELKGSVFPTTVMYGTESFGHHQPYDFLGLDDLASG